MEKLSTKIKDYVLEVIQNLEDLNKEDELLEIAKEFNFNIYFKLLMEEIVILALKQNKIVNSFFILKSVSRNSSQRLAPEFIQQVTPSEVPEKECEEIFKNITLFKGSLLKMLEKMNLFESRAQLIKSIVLNDKEINARLIYSDSEIESFNPDDFEIVLQKELIEKFKDKPIIINQE